MAASPGGIRFLRATHSGWFRAAAIFMERLILPGIMIHYTLRKRFIEESVRERLKDGVRQVIMLGAGFDTLAYRLQREFPDVAFIELDHPATQRVKVEVLSGALSPNLAYLSLDISTRDPSEVLLRCPAYDPNDETILIAEGLLMYLDATAVGTIIELAAQHQGRSAIIFTFMEPRKDGQIAFQHSGKLVDWWLKRRGEPFQWGIRREDLSDYLSQHGLDLERIVAPDELRVEYLPEPVRDGSRHANGDYICVARTRLTRAISRPTIL